MARKKKQRYYYGRPVKFENTYIEVAIQQFLKKLGISFRTQEPIFRLGNRDIFIPIPGKPGLIVEADGCFFHNCPLCFPGKRGRYKDKRITKELEKRGYIVLRFWEHQINSDLKGVMKKICEALEKV